MHGADERDRRVEELRRALYRRGSSGDDVGSYLAAGQEPAEPAESAEPAAPDRQHRRRRRRAVRLPSARARIAAGIALLAVLLALPALPGAAPRIGLPDPPVGEFSAAVPVPGAGTGSARSLWTALRSTSAFQGSPGVEVATAAGSGTVFATVAQDAVAARGDAPLTVFVACSTGSADLELTTVTQDFDTGYQVPFASIRVRCGGVQCLRYSRAAGLMPNAVSVVAGGRVAVSVVAGL